MSKSESLKNLLKTIWFLVNFSYFFWIQNMPIYLQKSINFSTLKTTKKWLLMHFWTESDQANYNGSSSQEVIQSWQAEENHINCRNMLWAYALFVPKRLHFSVLAVCHSAPTSFTRMTKIGKRARVQCDPRENRTRTRPWVGVQKDNP